MLVTSQALLQSRTAAILLVAGGDHLDIADDDVDCDHQRYSGQRVGVEQQAV